MIGVFGGSGFYEFLDDSRTAPVATSYGEPAATPVVGSVGGIEVAFIPRHGRNHQFPPHLVPYRANVSAMKLLGVDRIVASSAAGSIKAEWAPGHFAVPRQLVDRTWGRQSTFFDGPDVRHAAFADPYNAEMRSIAVAGMRSTGATVHDGGTVVVIQGPRFSTRAESASFASAGWELLNMTQMPEAALAAEAGICYVNVSVITDYDVGIGDAAPVTHDEVLRRFAESLRTLQQGIAAMIPPLQAAELSCPEP
ncbi:MAG: 5'-methylthioadenosine phosphorylase [Actinobacteria bacterium RBG_16_68_21]|nr:MAG: 5'-methylthioadenosine phosphorylase [Actinobacteria bacterium RBG_16_68_21]